MRTLLHSLRGLTLAALLALTAQAAESAKKNYNLPAGDAAVRLKQFSETSGRETLFAAEAVRGVRTTAVKGEFTPKEALDRMLDGTGLVVVQDEKTGALAVRRDTSPNVPRAALEKDSDRPTSQNKVEDGKLVLDTYHVAGLRDSGLVNQGVVPREEKGAIGFIVMDRQEIERSGATDINEVLRTLPQVGAFQADTQSLTAQRGFALFGAGVTPATRVDMRGFGTQGTTILVNGRRMPLVRESQGGGPDISRIPLSAIERIEVLPSSAGGLYGTNSMGGVINIILKKNYIGRELTVGYGQAAAGGANEYSLTYTEGRSLFGGKANLTWTFDARKREPMYYGDRPLYRRFLERNPPPGSGGTIASWVDSGAIQNFVSPSGVVVGGFVFSGFYNFMPAPLNIPGGASNIMFATLPANQNGASLTPASFLNSANQLTPGEPYAGFALFNPGESASLNLTYNHELRKDRLYWYAELGLGHTQFDFKTPPSPETQFYFPTDARNPFRDNVLPGYSGQIISVFYYPSDLPGTEQITENSTVRLVLGMNGQADLFGRTWKWALDASSDYNRRYAFGWTPSNAFFYISRAGTPQALAFYNPLADHRAFPNTAAANALAHSSFRENSDFVWQSEVTLRASGEVVNLPAGPVQASLVAEGRAQDYAVKFEEDFDRQLLTSLGVTGAPARTFVDSSTNRSTKQYGAELVIPALSRDFSVLGIERADFLAAYSHNQITDAKDFGTSNLGFRISPVNALTLRVSYGTGTYPPLETSTSASRVVNVTGDTTRDPRRGNSAIGNYTLLTGGNPDLKPETTTTWNFGAIFEPRFLQGFSATFDYGYIEKTDGILTLPLFTVLANEGAYPGRTVRATPTAADTALGWAGQIQQADLTPINAGKIWSQYLDTSIRYHVATESSGDFYVIFRSTNTREFRTKLRPESIVVDTLDQISSPLKFKASGSVSWRKGPWTLTPSFNYIESYRDARSLPVGNSFTANLQAVYEIPASARGTGWRRWVAGTQWTIGCNNLADSEPPYVQNPGGQSIAAYYSTYDDPRGRYYYVRVRKSL